MCECGKPFRRLRAERLWLIFSLSLDRSSEAILKGLSWKS